MKTYLFVPYSEKDVAKRLGAKWDPAEKKWYAPEGEKALVERWPIPPPITALIGEDRSFGGNQLFVDLVPRSCWFTNVRYCVEPRDWDRLRKFVYERAGNKCECCGAANSDGAPLAAHERWHFDLTHKTQKLMRIIALCEACHETTHMGLANVRGRGDEATLHLMKVTGITPLAADKHIEQAFKLWEERNETDWTLDLSVITHSGMALARKTDTSQRRAVSEKTLEDIGAHSSGGLVSFFSSGSTRAKRAAPEGGFDEKPQAKERKCSEESARKTDAKAPGSPR
jgi:hypothetical protein